MPWHAPQEREQEQAKRLLLVSVPSLGRRQRPLLTMIKARQPEPSWLSARTEPELSRSFRNPPYPGGQSGAKISVDDGRISPYLGYLKERLIIRVGIGRVKKKAV
jgi:hypothetical protein